MMQNQNYANASLFTLLVMWAAYRIRAVKPEYTCDEIARLTALSGNPPGA
jgi:hypothetical protein